MKRKRTQCAGVAELADAQDLNPAVSDNRTGSIPVLGTIFIPSFALLFCGRGETADALASGASGRNPVVVQIHSAAPRNKKR